MLGSIGQSSYRRNIVLVLICLSIANFAKQIRRQNKSGNGKKASTFKKPRRALQQLNARGSAGGSCPSGRAHGPEIAVHYMPWFEKIDGPGFSHNDPKNYRNKSKRYDHQWCDKSYPAIFPPTHENGQPLRNFRSDDIRYVDEQLALMRKYCIDGVIIDFGIPQAVGTQNLDMGNMILKGTDTMVRRLTRVTETKMKFAIMVDNGNWKKKKDEFFLAEHYARVLRWYQDHPDNVFTDMDGNWLIFTFGQTPGPPIDQSPAWERVDKALGWGGVTPFEYALKKHVRFVRFNSLKDFRPWGNARVEYPNTRYMWDNAGMDRKRWNDKYSGDRNRVPVSSAGMMAVYDHVPYQKYSRHNLRSGLELCFSQREVGLCQVQTWNHYNEGTQVAPSNWCGKFGKPTEFLELIRKAKIKNAKSRGWVPRARIVAPTNPTNLAPLVDDATNVPSLGDATQSSGMPPDLPNLLDDADGMPPDVDLPPLTWKLSGTTTSTTTTKTTTTTTTTSTTTKNVWNLPNNACPSGRSHGPEIAVHYMPWFQKIGGPGFSHNDPNNYHSRKDRWCDKGYPAIYPPSHENGQPLRNFRSDDIKFVDEQLGLMRKYCIDGVIIDFGIPQGGGSSLNWNGMIAKGTDTMVKRLSRVKPNMKFAIMVDNANWRSKNDEFFLADHYARVLRWYQDHPDNVFTDNDGNWLIFTFGQTPGPPTDQSGAWKRVDKALGWAGQTPFEHELKKFVRFVRFNSLKDFRSWGNARVVYPNTRFMWDNAGMDRNRFNGMYAGDRNRVPVSSAGMMAVYDHVPYQEYSEGNLRGGLEICFRQGGVGLCQVQTWNDYNEGTQVAPSNWCGKFGKPTALLELIRDAKINHAKSRGWVPRAQITPTHPSSLPTMATTTTRRKTKTKKGSAWNLPNNACPSGRSHGPEIAVHYMPWFQKIGGPGFSHNDPNNYHSRKDRWCDKGYPAIYPPSHENGQPLRNFRSDDIKFVDEQLGLMRKYCIDGVIIDFGIPQGGGSSLNWNGMIAKGTDTMVKRLSRVKPNMKFAIMVDNANWRSKNDEFFLADHYARVLRWYQDHPDNVFTDNDGNWLIFTFGQTPGPPIDQSGAWKRVDKALGWGGRTPFEHELKKFVRFVRFNSLKDFRPWGNARVVYPNTRFMWDNAGMDRNRFNGMYAGDRNRVPVSSAGMMAVYDHVPYQEYSEGNLRGGLEICFRQGGVGLCQVQTWNDYNEGTQVAPSNWCGKFGKPTALLELIRDAKINHAKSRGWRPR